MVALQNMYPFLDETAISNRQDVMEAKKREEKEKAKHQVLLMLSRWNAQFGFVKKPDLPL